MSSILAHPLPKTILERLGLFVAQTEFDSEPFSLGHASLIAELGLTSRANLLVAQSTIDMVRHALIDTLGCMLVGSRQPVSRKIQATAAVWGSGSAAVFGTDLKLVAPWAAMSNGAAAHSMDFDDWESPGNTHLSAVLFPALLAAAAESKTSPISGRALFDAYLVGFEVVARIGQGVNFAHYEKGWHSTATLGAIGAAAAVARLERLTAEQTTHAMALAFSQAVGYTAQFGSDAKALQAGFAAKTGVVAAALAANGLSGQPDILEKEKGFAHLMGPGHADRFPKVMERFGEKIAAAEFGLAVKPYPSCGYTHRVIDCALEIRSRPTFKANKIAKITASITDFHAAILPFQQPKNQAEALFSAPFCIAQALLHGRLTPADLAAETWNNPQVANLAAKVGIIARPRKNPELNYDRDDPDCVEVLFDDGSILRAQVAFPLGSPENPMSSEQILAKFLNNTGLQEDDGRVKALMGWVDTDNINEIIGRFI